MSDSESTKTTKKQSTTESGQTKEQIMIANTSAAVINGPEPMQFDDPGKYWSMWKQRFNIYLLASGKKKETDDVKIALLLHYIGEKGLDIYNSFNLSPQEETIENVLKKFDEYCNPKKNITMETFKFFNITQQQGQPFCEFETELRKQIKFCEFACSNDCKKFEDRILRDKIILGVFDKNLQTKLLEAKENDLNDVIQKCKVAELAEKNKKTLGEKNEVKIDALQRIDKGRNVKPREKICYRCGFVWSSEHRKQCPAIKDGRKCNKCKQPGHFASMCRVKSVGGGTNSRHVNMLAASADGEMENAVNAEYFDEAYNLHGIQYRITRRGAEMLEVGGRLVYSTCSLNPIENEAVLQRIIADSKGALEIVDASHLVPGLKFIPGMTEWKLASKEVDEIYSSFDEVPEKYHTIIRPNMFPMPKEEISRIGLEKCIRVLPHLQDSGAFFVAVLQKNSQLPFEKNDVSDLLDMPKPEVKLDAEGKPIEEKSVPWGPQRKRRRLHGYKEDPYVFFDDNDADWEEIKKFYDLDDTLNKRCLLTRCVTQKKKNIYYCSELIRDLVLLNESSIKIINTGVKSFVRCENRHTPHPFRLAQEGLQTTNAFVGESRRIQVEREDLILQLNCTDPTKPPSTTELKEATQQRCKELTVGSCIIKYVDERFTLYIVGWRGTSSLRAYVDSNETLHILRLLGADLSKFEVNKYEKAREAAAALEAANIAEDSTALTAAIAEQTLEDVESDLTKTEAMATEEVNTSE